MPPLAQARGPHDNTGTTTGQRAQRALVYIDIAADPAQCDPRTQAPIEPPSTATLSMLVTRG
jgi:hypothetical protein